MSTPLNFEVAVDTSKAQASIAELKAQLSAAQQPKTFTQFVIQMFSEPDGSVSSSRVTTFLSTMGVLALQVTYVIHTGQLPSGAESLLSLLGASAPYGFNQVHRAASGK